MSGRTGRLSRRAMLATGLAVPVSVGVGAAQRPSDLEAVLGLALAQSSTSVLVMRDGDRLAERYAPGWDATRPREVASVAKSLVAVLIAMAVEDGLIKGLDQPAADYIPTWRDDGRAAITLRHLMSMTSGLDDAGLALRGVAGDQFAINAAAPLRDPPGARWAYNTAAYHLLFHILVRATGETVEAYAARRLTGPLCMDDTQWVASVGQSVGGPTTNYYSAASTARDLARFGALVLGEGLWNGRRLIGADSLAALLQPSQALNPSYGLLWWTNARPGFDAFGRGPRLRFPSAPTDTVAALGAGGQMTVVVPSRRLVIVRQGETPPAADFAETLVAGVLAATS